MFNQQRFFLVIVKCQWHFTVMVSYKQMRIKTTALYHYIAIRMAKIKKTDKTSCCKGVAQWGLLCIAQRNANYTATLENSLLLKIIIQLLWKTACYLKHT